MRPGCLHVHFVELPLATAPWLRSVAGAPKAVSKAKSRAKAKSKRGAHLRGAPRDERGRVPAASSDAAPDADATPVGSPVGFDCSALGGGDAKPESETGSIEVGPSLTLKDLLGEDDGVDEFLQGLDAADGASAHSAAAHHGLRFTSGSDDEFGGGAVGFLPGGWSDDGMDGGAAQPELSPGAWSSSSAGRPRGKGARRLRKPLQVDGMDVPDDAWKRFTPDLVRRDRCLSRVWNGGRGGQCSRRPIAGKELCQMHGGEASFGASELRHGLVTGEMPPRKLMEFIAAERKREERSFAEAAGVELVKKGRKPRARKSEKLWYARYRFWQEASQLVRDTDEEKLTSISELTFEQRKICLQRTHEYFKRTKVLQFRGRGSGFVALGKGPALDAEVGDPAFAYNGSNKQCGFVFKWYRKALFQYRLRELCWTKDSV